MRWRTAALRALAPITAVVFALLVASVALVLVDRSPITAFVEMAKFAATLKSFISIMNRAYPLYISAIAVAIGFKMGLFNIGVEGQYLFASLLAAWVAASIALPAPLHVLVVLLVAVVVGSAWSGIAGVLKVTRGVHEVISTIMLNFIAFGLVSWLLANFLRQENEPGDLIIKTAEIPASGRFPSLNPLLAAIGLEPPRGSVWQGFLVVAILLGIGYYFLVWRTRFGYELRASGINPGAARAAGVDPDAMVIKTMLLSGAFAGLVAIGPLLGFFNRYTLDFPRQLGFIGIGIALLGRNHPLGMFLGAVLWGFMDRSAQILDLNDIPREIVQIMQGVIVLAVVIAYEVVTRFVEREQVKAAAAATATEATEAEVGEVSA